MICAVKDSSLVQLKQYGHVEICLKQILHDRNISRNKLATSIGTRFSVINKWYNNDVEKLDLDILDRICCVLECRAEDLIKYCP